MWNNDNNVEYLLKQDGIEKRRTARGAFHNSGKKGSGNRGVSSVKSAVDMLKWSDKKAYKEYIQGGVIVATNIFDNIDEIPTIAELQAKDFKSAQTIIKTVKGKHTVKALRKHWDLNAYRFYKLYDTYEIDYKSEKGARNMLPLAEPWKSNKSTIEEEQRKVLEQSKLLQAESQKKLDAIPILPITKQIPVVVEEDSDTFEIKFNKSIVTGSKIEDKILRIVEILDKESTKLRWL